jgi:hypothetical protein
MGGVTVEKCKYGAAAWICHQEALKVLAGFVKMKKQANI